MGVKQSVFASKAEKRNYDKLLTTWGDKFRIYHNLPFLNVFDFQGLIGNDGKPLELDDKDASRLKKTSIDYVLCDEFEHPVVGIDFDGMSEGVNVGTLYVPDPDSMPDEWRQIIMGLKLRVAHGSSFPYFIVGSREFVGLSTSTRLTIVDGIIGGVLARTTRNERFAQGFSPREKGLNQQQFDSLPEWEQDELLQEWAIDVEVDAEMSSSPLSNIEIAMKRELGVQSWSEDWTPPKGENDQQSRIWSTVTLHTKDHGDVSSSAWVPNNNSRFYDEATVTTAIATILACERLQRMRS